MNKRTPCHIRWTIAADMPRITEIENSLVFMGWSRKHLEDQLSRQTYIGQVASIEVNGKPKVIGHYIYDRDHGNQTIRLVRIVVDPVYRRLGYGTQMIQHIANKANAPGWKFIYQQRFRDDEFSSFLTAAGMEIVGQFTSCGETYLCYVWPHEIELGIPN